MQKRELKKYCQVLGRCAVCYVSNRGYNVWSLRLDSIIFSRQEGKNAEQPRQEQKSTETSRVIRDS